MAKKQRKVTAGLLADPAALAKLEQAAAAVGHTPEELVNFIVDSGLVALPPEDGVTDRYTLQDMGQRMWSVMASIPHSKRPDWFGKLAEPQQIALIVILRDQNYSQMTIAQNLGIKPGEVNKIWNQHASNVGAQVVGTRLDTIAGNLQLVAERVQEGAARSEDWRTVWATQKDLVKLLQDIGIVDRAIHKVEHTVKFEDQKKEAIDALLELERKKRERNEEIRQIEAEVYDATPQMVEDMQE